MFFLMDGVIVACSIVMTVEAARQCTKDGKEWGTVVRDDKFHGAIFVRFLYSFRPPSRALVVYHLEKGGLPLHDAVEANCENSATTDINLRRMCLV